MCRLTILGEVRIYACVVVDDRFCAAPQLHPEDPSVFLLSLLKFIAILTATIFTGAALYINLVEHSARMTLNTKSAALEWATSYARATRAGAVVLSEALGGSRVAAVVS